LALLFFFGVAAFCFRAGAFFFVTPPPRVERALPAFSSFCMRMASCSSLSSSLTFFTFGAFFSFLAGEGVSATSLSESASESVAAGALRLTADFVSSSGESAVEGGVSDLTWGAAPLVVGAGSGAAGVEGSESASAACSLETLSKRCMMRAVIASCEAKAM